MVPEAETGLGRGVHYIKKGYLARPDNEPALWHYREQFSIKPHFSIFLHSPFERVNAIQRRSTAVFQPTAGGSQNYRPRELSEHVFHKQGVLTVDWILETLERRKNKW